MEGMGLGLGSRILEVFSSLNCSVVVWQRPRDQPLEEQENSTTGKCLSEGVMAALIVSLSVPLLCQAGRLLRRAFSN